MKSDEYYLKKISETLDEILKTLQDFLYHYHQYQK